MCRGKNDPGGPVRCSHHMKQALLSTQAKYAESVIKLRQFESQLEEDKAYAAKLEHLSDSKDPKIIKELETLTVAVKKVEGTVNKFQGRAQTWKEKLQNAQQNYDSTRGGLAELAHKTNSVSKRLEDLEKHPRKTFREFQTEHPDLEEDEVKQALDEEKTNLEQKKRMLLRRTANAENTLTEERAWRVHKQEEAEEPKPQKPPVAEDEDETTNSPRIKKEDDEEEPSVPRIKKDDEEEEPANPRLKKEDDESDPQVATTPEEDEESTYQAIQNSEEGENLETGDPSDVLNNDELNEELDHIIEDLDIYGVNTNHGTFIDPDTGESFKKSEIEAYSRKMRREARARIRRQAMADGNTKEILKAFLRTAIYRALRYNKSTRKLTRLIGIQHFNSLVDKIDELQLDRQDKKLTKAKEKWKAKREKVADQELASLGEIAEKDEKKYQSQMEKIDLLKSEGKLSSAEYSQFKSHYENERKQNDKKIEYERNIIARMKIQWHEEETEELHAKESREEEVKQAIIANKRQREEVSSFFNSTE